MSTLNLQLNRISDAGAKDIAAVLANNKVHKLMFAPSQRPHSVYLDWSWLLQNLTHLDLGWNHITQVGARSLAEMLKANRVLCGLGLEGNRITAEGGMYLCESLENNHALTFLNIASCNLRKTGGVSIAALLRKNATLEELIVKKNGLTSQGVQVGPQPQVRAE